MRCENDCFPNDFDRDSFWIYILESLDNLFSNRETWLQIHSQVIQNGFRKAEIVSLNKNIIPEDQFPPRTLQRWNEHLANFVNTAQPMANILKLVNRPEDNPVAGPSSAETVLPPKDTAIIGPSSTETLLPPKDTAIVCPSSANSSFISFENLLLLKKFITLLRINIFLEE
ncbi:hypothetical protein FQA39_LY08199 [Lamprigera yunnana]|nr:hypothetical protein FQA39_LY08199 [Lamprigera yunnana]